MEDEEASLPQAATAEPSPSIADHRERTPSNVYDKHENFRDKPPEDVLNMRFGSVPKKSKRLSESGSKI